MGRITKTIQPKHKETLSPFLSSFVETASTAPIPLLPQHLATFPTRWPFPRGDLYHWIPLLNRFDVILEQFSKFYNLDAGPQTLPFGCGLLLQQSLSKDSHEADEKADLQQLAELGFPKDGDAKLVKDVLEFTRMLLEHCGNRSIYASSSYLNDLLNSSDLSILKSALQVGSELAQRYHASVKRIQTTNRQISAALLANHYNINLDRVLQMALPFVKTPIVSLSEPAPSTTPGSTSKSKDRSQGGGSKSAAASHANDLVAVSSGDDERWSDWGDVKVTYYPQEPAASSSATDYTGLFSQPSTPTPLRRSSTTAAQHATPKPRQTLGDDSSPLGPKTPVVSEYGATTEHKTFEVPKGVVLSHSIGDLMKRCPASMPEVSKYEAFNRIRVSKALVGSRETRQDILAVRLLAINNLAYIHAEGTFMEKVLRQDNDEIRKYQLVYQLAEMVTPPAEGKKELPLWLQSIAFALLEVVSQFHARCQDVLSALNANVAHGVLLYVIRKAVAGMKNDDPSDDGGNANEADEWRNSLFSLTLQLCISTRVGTEMVTAGIMEILVELLTLRSATGQRHHQMILAFLDNLIWTFQNAFQAFFSANGLEAIANLIVDSVKEARDIQQAGRGTVPDLQSQSVDYSIPYYQQQTLKWLFKFIHHIMANSYNYGGNTDRLLRNLADRGDLLKSLRDVIDDKQSYGAVVWTNCVTVLSDFINNDPTSFPAISESGMIRTFLAAITGRPLPDPSGEPAKAEGSNHDSDSDSEDLDSVLSQGADNDDLPHPPSEDTLRQRLAHPMASTILPSQEAINVVPVVLNSISLNNAGLKLVIESQAFKSFLEIFTSPAHVQCLEGDSELPSAVGSNFDELGRHHPLLRTSISNAVIDMVAAVRYFGLEKARSSGWGVKLYLQSEDGRVVSVTDLGDTKDADMSNDSVKETPNGDEDIAMSGTPNPPHDEGSKTSNGVKESATLSFTPYVAAMSSFLSQYLTNSTFKSNFVEKGGIELLLDIVESPSLSASSGESVALPILNSVITPLIEYAPARGLPSLLKRMQTALDTLEPLTSDQESSSPVFKRFLVPDSEFSPSPANHESALQGTKLAKALLNAQNLMRIVSECFAHGRGNTFQFYRANAYDYYLQLAKSLGPILKGVFAEENSQAGLVPRHWTRTKQDAESAGSGTNSKTEPVSEDSTMSAVLGVAESLTSRQTSGNSPAPSKEERSSAQYRNYETLLHLLQPMIPTSFPLFQSLGKALLPRREPSHMGPYSRARQLELSRALADAVVGPMSSSVAVKQPSTQALRQWVITIHTIHGMLIDHPARPQQGSTEPHVIMPVLMAFKEERGFEVLNSMVDTFASAIFERSDPEDESRPQVAAYGLKKILDLYSILANGKAINEAIGHYGVHKTTQPHNITHVSSQLVLEFRSAILPSVERLWSSSFVSKLSDTTVRALVNILKLVALAEFEPSSIPKDRVPFALFGQPDIRFNWESVREMVDELSGHYDAELAQEAVYRANGEPTAARAYCKAHVSGLAGLRNPIPAADVFQPAAAPVATEPRSTTSASDADQMSLDGPPTLPPAIETSLYVQEEPSDAQDSTPVPVPEPSVATIVSPPQEAARPPAAAALLAAKEAMDKQRSQLSDNLVGQSLDVIRAHPATAIDVADLINATILRHQNQEKQTEVASMLTGAITSLGLDEEEKQRNGKCIAAYTHLFALLLQDKSFFAKNVDVLREQASEYIGFLEFGVASDPPPWIPYMLLILEMLLCHDERPIPSTWKPPKSLDETPAPPSTILHQEPLLVNQTERARIMEYVVSMLPRIGKEEGLATAVLRILVILTRDHGLAKQIGEKKSLQRVFLMAKQLFTSGLEQLQQTKLTSYMMSILRHIVEDDDLVKQVMRAEITSEMSKPSWNHRIDIQQYLKAMSALALRNTRLFIEVSNEMLQFHRWTQSADGQRPPLLMLKGQAEGADEESADKVEEDKTHSPEDVKPSTETRDMPMTDAPKQPADSKRPVVENPDGVIHYLLSELINYRDVEDKEVPVTTGVEAKGGQGSSSASGASISTGQGSADDKDKKSTKPVFKAEEHPIFVYRCFLLSCLSELLQSYNRTKVEFINFKRKAPPATSSTPIKPRTSVLNYLIYDLLCQGNLSGTTDTLMSKKKAATSSQTQKVLSALVAKTKEVHHDPLLGDYKYDDEPDLLFVRKFVLDTILRAYEKAPLSEPPLEIRYSRMQCLAELMNHMIGERDKEPSAVARRNTDLVQRVSNHQLRRLMYEKGYVDKLTSSIAEINLNYPGVKRAIKYILRVLRVLTETAKELSQLDMLTSESSSSDPMDEDIISTSSLSDLDDEREETPDLYRNSTLGMLEPGGGEDEYDEDEDDEEDMYGDEYDDEEMDYGEEELSEDDEENISEEDEELDQMGEIEGLHGEPGVVEVIMDEDEDEESDEDDEMDSEDEDVDSADMDDHHQHVEILDEDGNPIDDDGDTWESASDDDEDAEDADEGDELDYEAQVQDVDEDEIHGMGGPDVLIDNMRRAIMADAQDIEMDLGLEAPFNEDGLDDEDEEEDEDDLDDEEYHYDDLYHMDEAMPQSNLGTTGWAGRGDPLDDMHQQILMLDRRQRVTDRILRMDRDHLQPRARHGIADFGNYIPYQQQRRQDRGQTAEDGVNPLLRRDDTGPEASHRHVHPQAVGLRFHESMFGTGSRMDSSPAGVLDELMGILPHLGRAGSLHFHVASAHPPHARNMGDLRFRPLTRETRREGSTSQEPSQVAGFAIESTLDRYHEEARMLFGSALVQEAQKLAMHIYAALTPEVMAREKRLLAQEAKERQERKEAEERKKAEEAREAEAQARKEQEARAAREQEEAEQRRITEAAQAEQRRQFEAMEAALAPGGAGEPSPTSGSEDGPASMTTAMEGVEATHQATSANLGAAAASSAPDTQAAAAADPQAITIIRGREIDVSQLGIDPDYLAALPEEYREEVIAQTVSTRRSQAREEATAGESGEVFQEFLDALPEDLRQEIVQQERQEQRRRNNRDDGGHQSGASAPMATDMNDPASILMTLPPEIRTEVLMEQGHEIMDQLTPELAAEARVAMSTRQARHTPSSQRPRQSLFGNAERLTGLRDGSWKPLTEPKQRRRVVQMLDKAGVATLLRLMFIAQQGSARNYLFSVLTDISENRQNRIEVISTVLQILQDGSTDMGAVERSFGHLSLRAKKHKEKDPEQKTPQALKRTLTGPGSSISVQLNSETSPLLIVQQCLDLLVELSGKNPHIPLLFLTEHETVGSTLKRSLSRKGKLKDTKAHKFAINSLLSLLDRDLVIESSVVMAHLADLLNRVTFPLHTLDRRRKALADAAAEKDKSTNAEAQPAVGAGPSTSASATDNVDDARDDKDKSSEGKASEDKKKLRQIQEPVVPPHMLTLVVRIFVARECSSKTFQNTISTIKNLSHITGAKQVFGQELVQQARFLSKNIVTDLDDLLPHIEQASSGTEIQGVALAKFSPGASEQNKLLRVLTALDHLFDSKKKDSQQDASEDPSEASQKQDLLSLLYQNSSFSQMWQKLSACLKAIRQRENMLNVATILLPLIESLMVVCKDTTSADEQEHLNVGKDMILNSPPPEFPTKNLFFKFTEDHRRILNELVRHNPKLMSGTFALLVKNPKVLEFDNKRNYFKRSVHSKMGPNQTRPSYPALQLNVRRQHVFHDSFKPLYFRSGEEMKYGKLNIRFHGEEGVDAGGVTREWFQVLARQMFDPNYALFIPVSSDQTTFHPNKLSGVNEEHLMFFKFIGRIIGKALYEDRLLDCYFSRAVYKRILGKSVSVKDMESFDPDYYKSLIWMLENDITDIITETFSVEEDQFGVVKTIDLIPNGRETTVTEENKTEYVRLIVEHKLLSSVKNQMEEFLKGFHDIIPPELISIFNEQELELLISGLPDIDIDDWKANTEYTNYSPSSSQIQWFWRALRSFDKEERAKLLQFVTGTSKVPLNGFKSLEGMNGVSRFNIHRDYGNKDRLPSSHTCFNQFDLPEYESYEILRAQILKAITTGSEYFGFA